MIGGAVGIRAVEQIDQPLVLVVDVVVERARLVGVDVQFRHAGDLRQQRRIRQPAIEIAPLSVKGIAVGISADELGDRISVTGVGEGADRVFLGVGVEVADQQHVGIVGEIGIGLDPVGDFVGCQHAVGIPAALSIASDRR